MKKLTEEELRDPHSGECRYCAAPRDVAHFDDCEQAQRDHLDRISTDERSINEAPSNMAVDPSTLSKR